MNSQRTFAGIPSDYASREKAKIYLQSIPYDGTSTWGKGADLAYAAFMDAVDNIELYDIETNSEVYKNGIYLVDESPAFNNPSEMFQYTYNSTKNLLKERKFLTFFGGEHSISIGLIKAYYEHFENLTVLQLDAHADLRPSYNGTPYNHACAVYDASKNCNLIQVGIRSMDVTEKEHMNYKQTYFADAIQDDETWMASALQQMTDRVYITIDLDVLDPSIMPATGTPEPGGLDWYTTTKFLKSTFDNKNVVGFDIVELAPIPGQHSPQYLAAKLYYKMLSYKFCNYSASSQS